MNATSLEAKIQIPLPAEMDAITDTLLMTHDMSDVDPRTISAIEYSTLLPGGQPDEHELEVTIFPSSHSARVGFLYQGEMHGMYFRFKRGNLETADRTTNGYQPCEADKEDWFRQVLDEMKNNESPDAKFNFRFHTEEPVALRF